MKRTLKIAGLVVGAVVGLLVLAAIAVALFVDLDGIVNEQVAKYRPEIEQQLGRKVELGKITTGLFPTLRVNVESAQISGQKDGDEPLVTVGPTRVEVGLWDAIISMGDRITVKELVVSQLRVNLVRAKDGTLSYEDILARQSSEPEEEEPATDEKSGLGDYALNELRVEDAEFKLVDYATATGEPAESRIKKLNLRVEDVRAGKDALVHVDAALFADATNFELDVSAGPLPRGGTAEEPEPSLRAFKLKLDAVDLSKLGPYLPSSSGAKIDSALASAQWEVGAMSEAAPFPVKGFFELKQVQLEGGKKFDLRIDTDLTADLKGPGVQIARFDLAIGEVKLTASGALSDLSTEPKFKDFKLSSTTLSPSALLSYYPAAASDLPRGTRFGGAGRIDVLARGDAQKQNLDAKVDLSALDVFYPGNLVKPAGVPLKFEVKGDFTKSDAALERMALVLDELALVIRGTVRDFDKPQFDLTASAAPFSLDRLVRLVPSIQEELAAQKATASGRGKLDGHLKGTQSNLDGALTFAMEGMKLDVPGTKLDGDLRLHATAKGDPSNSLRAKVDFNADDAVIRVEDTLDKGAKTPFHLTTTLQRTAQRLNVEKFDLRLAELAMRATGGIDYSKNAVEVKVDFDKLDLEKFARTVTAIPAKRVKNGSLAMKLSVAGDPDRLETIEVAMSDIDLRMGKSDLRGTATLKNPSTPDMKMKLRSRVLDLDEMFPDDEDEDEEDEAEEADVDDPELKEYRVLADLEADKVIYYGTDLTNFRGIVRLEDGRVKLEEARFDAYGGTVSAKGTEAEIWRGKIPFDAKITASAVDLGRALGDHTKYANVLQGKADLTLNLKGKGYSTDDLEKFLTGDIGVAMKQGKFVKADIANGVLGKLDGLNKIPGMKLQPVTGDNSFKDLVAKLVVKDGKMSFVNPVTFAVDKTRATLGGAIGIAGKLFLDGTYLLPPEVLSAATAGKCKSAKDLAVPLEIIGSINGPEFLPKPGEVSRAIVQSCVASAATSAAANTVKEKLGVELPTSTDDAKKLAEEAMAKQKAEAELKLRQEAEKRAAEERRKAEEAARKKAAEELKKKFGF